MVQKKKNTSYCINELLFSISSNPSTENELYEQINSIVQTYGAVKASAILKSFERTCVIKNRTALCFNNLHAQLLIFLFSKATSGEYIVSMDDLRDEFQKSHETIRHHLKDFEKLSACFYDFHSRVFFDDIQIFKVLSVKQNVLRFAFSNEFHATFLRSGATLYLPKAILEYPGKESGALVTLSALTLFSKKAVQNAMKNYSDTFVKSTTVSLRLRNLFDTSGIDTENQRLDNVRRWTHMLYEALLDYDFVYMIQLYDDVQNVCYNMDAFDDLKKIKSKEKLLNCSLRITFR